MPTNQAVSQETRIMLPAEASLAFRAAQQPYYDLIVLGGDLAGLSAAEFGAALGVQVALLDREKRGGECLISTEC